MIASCSSGSRRRASSGGEYTPDVGRVRPIHELTVCRLTPRASATLSTVACEVLRAPLAILVSVVTETSIRRDSARHDGSPWYRLSTNPLAIKALAHGS